MGESPKWMAIKGGDYALFYILLYSLLEMSTLWQTNIAIFPGKYHQNGGFSRAVLAYRSAMQVLRFSNKTFLL